MAESRQLTTIEIDGALTTSSTDQFIAPFALDLVGFNAVVGTGPTGADLIFDIEVNGTDLYASADRLKIVAGQTEGKETTAPNKRLAEGDNLVVKIAQVGSTVAGSDLDLSIEYVPV